MVDIYKIPLYYIRFGQSLDFEDYWHSQGFADIHHFEAIDGRVMDPTQIYKDGTISTGAYIDIVRGREVHYGMTKGAVGCALSHYALWQLCVDQNLPYIIIAEDDAVLIDTITPEDLTKINQILAKPNSIFLSPHNRIDLEDMTKFHGAHFYIASQGACQRLLTNNIPIGLQVDWYMGYIAARGDITIEGFKIIIQSGDRPSVIQDVRAKCTIPRFLTTNLYYSQIIGLILIAVILLVILTIKHKQLF